MLLTLAALAFIALVGVGERHPGPIATELPSPSLRFSEVQNGWPLDEAVGSSCLPDDYVRTSDEGVLRGRVVVLVGEKERPEPWVYVISRQGRTGTVALEDGRFELAPIRAGPQMIEFKGLHFEPIKICVDLTPTDTTEVTLVLEPLAPN